LFKFNALSIMNICLLSDTIPPDPGGPGYFTHRLASGLAPK